MRCINVNYIRSFAVGIEYMETYWYTKVRGAAAILVRNAGAILR